MGLPVDLLLPVSVPAPRLQEQQTGRQQLLQPVEITYCSPSRHMLTIQDADVPPVLQSPVAPVQRRQPLAPDGPVLEPALAFHPTWTISHGRWVQEPNPAPVTALAAPRPEPEPAPGVVHGGAAASSSNQGTACQGDLALLAAFRSEGGWACQEPTQGGTGPLAVPPLQRQEGLTPPSIEDPPPPPPGRRGRWGKVRPLPGCAGPAPAVLSLTAKARCSES